MSDVMSKKELLKQIVATNFMVEDLQLYLNTHPMDREALVKFNGYVVQLHNLKQNYQSCYGMLSAHGAMSPYPWQWISEPWPWEYEANYKLDGEER